ncbi:MAG: hypothetical protein H7641_10675, partial [Candidatus Heimdallarchaeota archaeon]|nr:hypothetical protein [Candidatus Heimdallarchaeota archaeon]MCK4878026.1 hypothetical protein [Candidatus Heimdallarchaeota archaeon]
NALEENDNQNNIYTFDQTTWNWTSTEVTSNDNTDFSYVPSLAVDSANNVHIAWESVDIGGTLADHKISYKRWDALTQSWTTTEIISTESTTGSFNPCVATDSNNNLHVVWGDESNYDSSGDDRDIFYKKWIASTSAWSTTYVVSIGSSVYSHHPDLTIDSSGKPHVVWADDLEIYYSHWNDTSSSWTSAKHISTTGIWGGANYPTIEVDIFGNIHIVYEQAGPVDTDLHYTKWNATTSLWSSSVDISIGIDLNSLNPSIDSDSKGNVHVTWAGNINGVEYNIFYRKWDAGLGDWFAFEEISTETTEYLKNPSLCVDIFNNIHVAWEDSTNYALSGTDWDIFYKRWDESNSSWTTTEVLSTESSGASYYPSLGVGLSGIIHIVWQDVTNYAGAGTDEDVFYKSQFGPPITPELAFIIPNPVETSAVYLNWNDIEFAQAYYVYRSTSYIWSIEELIPITSVSSSEYTDILPSEGYYYYVIVARNIAGNSTQSNCQYVEVKFPDLNAPELSFVLPNPTDIDSISLVWDSVDGAIEYYVYRSDTYIWSVEGLIPIATEISTTFVDTLPDEGFYFYVIVATDGVRNSTHSNCEYIQYKLPVLSEFVITSSLILGTFVCLFVIMRTRKKKTKPN